MNRLLVISCLFAAFCLMSCGTASSGRLPNPIGSTGEVLIVMNDYLWRGASGDSIRQYLTEPVWGMPSIEPMFILSHQRELSTFFRRFRNILIVNVDADFEEARLRMRSNVHAQNQLVFNLDAPSADSVISIMYRSKDIISDHILANGREAIIEDLRRAVAMPIVERLREKFMVDIAIPRSYTLDVDRENFAWVSLLRGEQEWGILIWEEPYLRVSQLDTDSLILRMNAMTRQHVPGPVEGSFMRNEPTFVPDVRRFEHDGIFRVQLNGLWQIQHGFMGGPYVKQTIVDTQRGRLITGLGFVFYPNRDKRQMIRQLEAMLFTMRPTESEELIVMNY